MVKNKEGSFEDKVNSFIKLANFIKKNKSLSLSAAFFIVIMTFAVSVAWNVGVDITTILSKLNPKHSFERNLKVDSMIQDVLKSLLNDIKADRILIPQFHNGITGDGNIPFSSYSVRYGDAAPGVDFRVDKTASMPLSILTELNIDIWAEYLSKGVKPSCIKKDVLSIENQVLRQSFQTRGTSLVYICPIVDIHNVPLGILVAEYLYKDRYIPNDRLILERMSEFAGKIAGYLQTVRLAD